MLPFEKYCYDKFLRLLNVLLLMVLHNSILCVRFKLVIVMMDLDFAYLFLEM